MQIHRCLERLPLTLFLGCGDLPGSHVLQCSPTILPTDPPWGGTFAKVTARKLFLIKSETQVSSEQIEAQKCAHAANRNHLSLFSKLERTQTCASAQTRIATHSVWCKPETKLYAFRHKTCNSELWNISSGARKHSNAVRRAVDNRQDSIE